MGYEYEKDGEKFVEYHVDDHIKFQKIGDDLPYGGGLSVRKPHDVKPLMILGQDKCIFKQFIFSKGVWVLPDGTKQLVPKEEGQGVMLSSFCCRELGYAYPVSGYVLSKVNKMRENQEYSDKDAARIKNQTTKKLPLVSSPFVRELDYSVNAERYWTYEAMVLQMEI